MNLFPEFRASSWDAWRPILGRITLGVREFYVIKGRGAGGCAAGREQYERRRLGEVRPDEDENEADDGEAATRELARRLRELELDLAAVNPAWNERKVQDE